MSGYDSVIYGKAHQFALEIIKVHKQFFLREFSDIFRQLLKSGTSIGANLAEANGAISMDDFSAKVSIAFKEMKETKYWLLLMKDSSLISQPIYEQLNSSVDELCKMAFSILKTTGRVKHH